MDQLKRLKRGEYLFKEGDTVQSVFIVKSGKLSLVVERNGHKIELMTAGPSQVLGEQILFSTARQSFSVEAQSETQIMEVPLQILKSQYEGSPPGIKLLVKSLVDEVRQAKTMLRSIKMEKDKSPCPQVAIPRMFAILSLVTQHTGKVIEAEKSIQEASSQNNADQTSPNTSLSPAQAEGEPASTGHTVEWGTLKIYVARMFAESNQRMRSILDILVKTNLAEVTSSVDEDGQEQVDRILIKDLQLVEDFAQFYQYQLYKGGKSEVLYVDPLALKMARVLTDLAAGQPVDHKGAVWIPYSTVAVEFKKRQGSEMKGTHLDVLERKGLFTQRKLKGDESFLVYDPVEFKEITGYWNIIFEIDKWNEKGFVDLNEKDSVQSEAATANCPKCQGPIAEDHKFCPACGHSLKASDAA